MTELFRIMVVDDNPSLSELVAETLDDEFEVFKFDSGEEALGEIEDISPHVVLLDIMMPGMDGFEVCKAIRAKKLLENVKILFLSAKSQLQDRLAGYEAKADDFLVKPFDPEELKAKVKVYIRLVQEEKRRKAIEEELRASEEKYRSLIENSPDVTIIHTNLNGEILFSNVEFPQRSNGDPTTNVFQLIPKRFHNEVKDKFAEVSKSGNVASLEIKSKDQEGKDSWFSTHIGPIKKDGTIEGMTLFTRNVTERKQMEHELIEHKQNLQKLVQERTWDLERTNEELQQEVYENKKNRAELKKSEEKYRNILENIEEGYYELDLEGNVTFFNTSLSKILNLPENWLLHKNILSINDKINTKKLEKTLEYVSSTGIPSPVMKWEIPLTDGTIKYLETSVSLIKDGDSKIGYRGVVRNITDRLSQEKTLEGLFKHAVGTLARAAEVFDQDTGDHTVRIGEYSKQLSALAGMNEQFQKDIQISAQLHDVGKIHITSSILTKSSRLTDDEFESIKNHTLYGSIIIGKNPDFKMANEVAMFHHEKWDGSGYPDGLKGRAIPLAARITAIVDVFDALVSKRSYKNAFSYEEAKDIIINGDYRLNPLESFDPGLLQNFIDHYHLFVEIHQESLKLERLYKDKLLNVIVLEDNQELLSAIQNHFRSTTDFINLNCFSTITDLTRFLSQNPTFEPQLCFIDVRLPDGSGHEAATILRDKYPYSHLICMTADDDIDVKKVNLYGHRVFQKNHRFQRNFLNNLVKTAEIIKDYHHNPYKLA